MSEAVNVVFVAGPPGAGKTSVSEGYEREHAHVAQFGTGELVWDIAAGQHDSKYAAILREAAQKHAPLSGEVFSLVVHEKIMRLSNDAESVIVTGFPHDYADWKVFGDMITDNAIQPIGSVVLNADVDTCVSRMQERDIKKGVAVEKVSSIEARASYEGRYLDLMARLAIRLDCYRESGLDVVAISALQNRDIVLSQFSDAVDSFKK
jgi:adenylate kinase family enzyme